MAAQQQQQQMIAAAQLNQAATIQAAQLQAQIQAQARAHSIQNLQQAAQMQSSAQNAAAAAAMAASVAMDQFSEQLAKAEAEQSHQNSQIQISAAAAAAANIQADESKLIAGGDYQMISEQQIAPQIIHEATNLITSSTSELNQFEESAVNTTTVTSEPSSETILLFNSSETETESLSNDISSSSSVIKQAPRIIYNSPAVMASLVTTPITKP